MKTAANGSPICCPSCSHEVTGSPILCPHCGASQRPANVLAAERERVDLARRYDQAVADHPDCLAILNELEKIIDTQSHAVIARDAKEVLRLAASDVEHYGNYYQMLGAGIRRPGTNWYEENREMIDSLLFPHYKDRILMAALSLTQTSLPHYGNCHLQLKTNFIEARSSVFESNSLLFVANMELPYGKPIPAGFRATWDQRGRLAVVKHAEQVTANTQATEFPSLILCAGVTGEDDHFIEVHVHGTITINTVEAVCYEPSHDPSVWVDTLSTLLQARSIPLRILTRSDK